MYIIGNIYNPVSVPALFVQFMDEADALFSRGDHASAADVLMKATLYDKMLTDIEGGEGSQTRQNCSNRKYELVVD